MSGLFIGLSLIMYAYLYNIIVNVFNIKKSLAAFTVLYCLIGFSVDIVCAAIYSSYISKAELLILPICLMGAIIRIGAYFFRRQNVSAR